MWLFVESFGVCCLGAVECGLASFDDDSVVAVVKIGGPEVADTGVVVDLVVGPVLPSVSQAAR